MLSRPHNYWYSRGGWKAGMTQGSESSLILSQEGSKGVGELPVHAYCDNLTEDLQKRTN